MPARGDAWIRIPEPVPEASTILVCAPHAGASASTYAALAAALGPSSVEVRALQYPGREDRRDEPALDDVGAIARGAADALLVALDGDGRSVAVLGHSMGAAVAFEVTRRLEAAGRRCTRLFVSGRRAPCRGLGVGEPSSDDDIVAELESLGGTGTGLLDRPRMRELILSVLRHDFRANARYARPAGTTVAAPVTYLLADADPYVDRSEALAWAAHTSGELSIGGFAGDHFFLRQRLPDVVARILADLAGAQGSPAR